MGTGGDGSNSFNISTTASIVISAAGVPVAKHGNRAASSKSGAADCLEALGVNITIEPEQSRKLLEEIGICFLFAQKYHTAMKYVGPIRKELGIRTIFNILGPLANPAGPVYQIMGAYDESLLPSMAKVLSNLGVKRGMVVYGQDRLDEISVSAPTAVCEIDSGTFKNYVITPEDFGLVRCMKEDLVGGTPQENAEITRSILNGEKGPKRNAVLLNAAAALYVAGKADSMADGVKLAEKVIDTGLAQLKRVPVVQMETDRQAGFDHGGFHQLDQVRTVGILARAGRYLQDHRRVALLGSLRDALNDLHIVHVEGANGIAACIRFCKHFLRSYNRH